jgi:hypothetical protein
VWAYGEGPGSDGSWALSVVLWTLLGFLGTRLQTEMAEYLCHNPTLVKPRRKGGGPQFHAEPWSTQPFHHILHAWPSPVQLTLGQVESNTSHPVTHPTQRNPLAPQPLPGAAAWPPRPQLCSPLHQLHHLLSTISWSQSILLR